MDINLFASPTFAAEASERIARWAKGLPVDYTDDHPSGSLLPASLCQFQDLVSAMVWVIQGQVDMESPLVMALDRTDTQIGEGETVQELITERFATQIAQIASFIYCCVLDGANKSQICKELGAATQAVETAAQRSDGPPKKFMAVLRKKVGKQKLESFYITTPQASGFLQWQEAFIFTATGTREHRREATSGGEIDFYVAKYKTYDQYIRLQPYEWHASVVTTRDLASKMKRQPDAIACGMVYTARRPYARHRIGGDDLLIASDEVTDVDVLQVSAFLKQHRDADALLKKGDIAFVWLWERHSRAKKGTGTECIQLAVAQLTEKFPEIATVVIDLKPYQFLPQGEFDEPPAILVKRLEALDALQEHVNNVFADLPLEIRLICNRETDITDALSPLYKGLMRPPGAKPSRPAV